jgi:inhibitor of cysteine peptidase
MRKHIGPAFVLIVFAACTSQLGTMDLTASNNGAMVDASVNQILNITLDSNVTTGFKWNLVTEPDAKILKFVSSEYVPPAPSSTPRVGAGGTEVWKFQAVGAGSTTFKLAYFRPFDPKDVAKEFSVTVAVK